MCVVVCVAIIRLLDLPRETHGGRKNESENEREQGTGKGSPERSLFAAQEVRIVWFVLLLCSSFGWIQPRMESTSLCASKLRVCLFSDIDAYKKCGSGEVAGERSLTGAMSVLFHRIRLLFRSYLRSLFELLQAAGKRQRQPAR